MIHLSSKAKPRSKMDNEQGLEMHSLAGDLHDAEKGHGRRLVKGKGVARDQADYLKSDPGTPNLSET
jgi:hypothetical protein